MGTFWSAEGADFGPADADAEQASWQTLTACHSSAEPSLGRTRPEAVAPCEEAREDAREDEDVDPVELAKELLHGWDSRPFGSFWVGAEATVRQPQDARESCKGTVVGEVQIHLEGGRA